MANNVSAGIGEKYSAVLQTELYESFVWFYIANTKFEGDFVGNDTVHFPRYNKLTVQDLVSSYDTFTPQDVVLTDETFVLDQRKVAAYEISDEDYIEMKVDVDNPLIKSMKEAFANAYDTEIFSEYANAGYVVDDGDMTTASNWGVGNAIIPSKSNIYDLVTAVVEKMDENDIPSQDRFLVLSPKEKRLLANAPELLRSTEMGDRVVTWGFMGEIDGVKIWYSNNLQTVAWAPGVKHAIAGQGKPISFAANIRPQVTFVGSEYKSNSFVNTVKAQSKFGVKTFHEGAIRMIDVQIVA